MIYSLSFWKKYKEFLSWIFHIFTRCALFTRACHQEIIYYIAIQNYYVSGMYLKN